MSEGKDKNKSTHTVQRNTDRRNGKAPKKNPKRPRTKGVPWSEREALRREKRVELRDSYNAKQQAAEQARLQRRLEKSTKKADKKSASK